MSVIEYNTMLIPPIYRIGSRAVKMILPSLVT